MGKNENDAYELCGGTGSPEGETTGGLASRGTGSLGVVGLVEYTDTLVATLLRDDKRRIIEIGFAGDSRFGRFSMEVWSLDPLFSLGLLSLKKESLRVSDLLRSDIDVLRDRDLAGIGGGFGSVAFAWAVDSIPVPNGIGWIFKSLTKGIDLVSLPNEIGSAPWDEDNDSAPILEEIGSILLADDGTSIRSTDGIDLMVLRDEIGSTSLDDCSPIFDDDGSILLADDNGSVRLTDGIDLIFLPDEMDSTLLIDSTPLFDGDCSMSLVDASGPFALAENNGSVLLTGGTGCVPPSKGNGSIPLADGIGSAFLTDGIGSVISEGIGSIPLADDTDSVPLADGAALGLFMGVDRSELVTRITGSTLFAAIACSKNGEAGSLCLELFTEVLIFNLLGFRLPTGRCVLSGASGRGL